ncbi:MAG: class I SAM-dependent methyltransferase [Acidimicrobiales bacterium]
MSSPALPQWGLVDSVYVNYLAQHEEFSDRWLLVQTLATGGSRRALLSTLGVQPGWRVLDVGTGFGPIPIELAGMLPVAVHGIDNNPANLFVADQLNLALSGQGWFQPESTVSFGPGDIYELPFEDDHFDLVSARLIFQYLDDPMRAIDEIRRVLRPGGGVCLIDADDGLSITYPQPSEAFTRLQQAFAAVQAARGGDRQVGRKLSTYLHHGGFDVMSVLVLPQAGHGPSSPDDLPRSFALDRLRSFRDDMVKFDIMTAGEVDACLDLYSRENIEAQCNIEGHLAVVARLGDQALLST